MPVRRRVGVRIVRVPVRSPVKRSGRVWMTRPAPLDRGVSVGPGAAATSVSRTPTASSPRPHATACSQRRRRARTRRWYRGTGPVGAEKKHAIHHDNRRSWQIGRLGAPCWRHEASDAIHRDGPSGARAKPSPQSGARAAGAAAGHHGAAPRAARGSAGGRPTGGPQWATGGRRSTLSHRAGVGARRRHDRRGGNRRTDRSRDRQRCGPGRTAGAQSSPAHRGAGAPPTAPQLIRFAPTA